MTKCFRTGLAKFNPQEGQVIRKDLPKDLIYIKGGAELIRTPIVTNEDELFYSSKTIPAIYLKKLRNLRTIFGSSKYLFHMESTVKQYRAFHYSPLITDIYNKKTKGPALMEFLTATGKLKKKIFFWTTRYVRCVPCHPWCTHRIYLVVKKKVFLWL